MEDFFVKTLEPSIFWSAISAIGTLLAVLTALFLHTIRNRQKVKKITKLVKTELSECMNKVYGSESLSGVPEKVKPTARTKLLERISTDVWDAHNNFLLAESPDKFLPYRNIYGLLTHIKSMASSPTPEVLQVLDYDVESLKEKYKKMFPDNNKNNA